jgi:hypothetical protein
MLSCFLYLALFILTASLFERIRNDAVPHADPTPSLHMLENMEKTLL